MYWEKPQLFNDAVASFLKDAATAQATLTLAGGTP
jgi:hypothetical protein